MVLRSGTSRGGNLISEKSSIGIHKRCREKGEGIQMLRFTGGIVLLSKLAERVDLCETFAKPFENFLLK